MILEHISAIAEATSLVVAALFPIVNPLGSSVIVLNMVGDLEPQVNRLLAQKIAMYSFFILMVSLIGGVEILSFFGISIYAVQIGGGLIVASSGWSLLNRPGSQATAGKVEARDVLGNAFYPYTLPIMVGPGSISVAVTLGAHLTDSLHVRSVLSPLVLITALLGVVLICAMIYLCCRYANSAERILGKSGTAVALRLLSFILLCIGIQIICSGLRAYWSVLHS